VENFLDEVISQHLDVDHFLKGDIFPLLFVFLGA
jgi:hypothetical protein